MLQLKGQGYEIREKVGSIQSFMLKVSKPGTSRAVIVSGYLADGLPLKYLGLV